MFKIIFLLQKISQISHIIIGYAKPFLKTIMSE